LKISSQISQQALSHFLLAIYLLVTLLSIGQHSHSVEVMGSVAHQHEDFEEVHHEHHFHVGIFHFFGHLFEQIIHQEDNDEQKIALLISASSAKKVIQQKSIVSYYYPIDNDRILVVDAESLPDPPPYHLFLLHRLKQPNTPLRAPPVLV
jgi:hypothetical protein